MTERTDDQDHAASGTPNQPANFSAVAVGWRHGGGVVPKKPARVPCNALRCMYESALWRWHSHPEHRASTHTLCTEQERKKCPRRV